MIKLGLDFDNTLIDYDEVFYEIAAEKNLIPKDIIKTKIEVRRYLKNKGKEKLFTLLQGEVYGSKINLAKQSDGMFETLMMLKKQEIELFIVSHKTLHPYAGPKFNLHLAALKWLTKNEFFTPNGLNFKKENIFFELTVENKIKRIESLGITHYIDDLTKILELIKPTINRIHYNPKAENYNIDNLFNLKSWAALPKLLEELS